MVGGIDPDKACIEVLDAVEVRGERVTNWGCWAGELGERRGGLEIGDYAMCDSCNASLFKGGISGDNDQD